MRLQKLDLIGFKSFSDPTIISFQSGISVIVGPNGCGKSNIVDAILWVLGEQSTKTLRSDRMEDVIFNGSESRKPIGLAEVSLTVTGVTAREVLSRWGEFEELTICRRLFRSGDSEYLINKIPCRLKDIREVLIDTGAGHKGHTIIEQGKVDQLLSSSAGERRGLIEDTAGIGKYKIRKAEAERKLEATHQNLLRVRDIIAEVKRQIQALDRQVRKTETYNTLRGEAQGLERRLLAEDYRASDAELQTLSRRVREDQDVESRLNAELAALEAKILSEKTRLIEEERVLNEARQKAFDLQTRIQRQESRIELLASQVTGWEDQRTHFAEERERLDQSAARAAAELEDLSKKQEALRQALGELKGRVDTEGEACGALESRITERQASLEAEKSRIFEILGEVTEAKNQLAADQSRSQEIVRVREKSRADIAGLTGRIHQAERILEEELGSLSDRERQAVRDHEEKDRLGESIRTHQKEMESAEESVRSKRDQLTHAEARLASVVEREQALLAAQLSVRERLADQTDLLGRFAGIVADSLSVATEYEKAIEAALGERLNALIAEDHTAILGAIRHLKASGTTGGVFIPRTLRTKVSPPGTRARDGVIGPAISCVQSGPGMEGLLQAILGGVILVRDLETAIEIWKEQPLGELLVTLEGEVVFPSGMVSGGPPSESAEGLLQTRRKRAELDGEIKRVRDEAGAAESDRSRLAGSLEELIRGQETVVQKYHEAEIEKSAQREKVSSLTGELDRLLENRSLLELEDRQRSGEIEETEVRIAEAGERIRTLEARHEEALKAIGEGQGAVRQWEEEFKGRSAGLTQLRIDLSSMNERSEILIREDERIRREAAADAERRTQRQSEIEGLGLRIQAATRDREETESEIGRLAAELTGMQSDLANQTESYTAELNRVKELEGEQSRVRLEAGRIEHRLKDLQIREAEFKMKAEHLREQLTGAHSTTPDAVLSEWGTEPFDREGAAARLADLRGRMDQMGPVNLAAPEEYKELEERYRFLSEQETDLNTSVEDLQKAIQKINRTARELFVTTFQSLRDKFREVFVNFFEGGQADLVLEDESSPLESPIEIMAQPPGKRLRHISLLSGGEKALTAISLLFASFLIHPTPFCVLDEIDAPLDEENTRRFLRALRQMTSHSQFLVITHNKRTMEQGDVLYGVTMEEPGVSKLVSVKLESAGNGNGRGNRHAETPQPTTPTATA